MTEKLAIIDYLDYISPYEFAGTLEGIHKQITVLIKRHGKDARIDWDADHWEPYASESSPRFEITVRRPETDEEHFKRIEAEKSGDIKQISLLESELMRLKKKVM